MRLPSLEKTCVSRAHTPCQTHGTPGGMGLQVGSAGIGQLWWANSVPLGPLPRLHLPQLTFPGPLPARLVPKTFLPVCKFTSQRPKARDPDQQQMVTGVVQESLRWDLGAGLATRLGREDSITVMGSGDGAWQSDRCRHWHLCSCGFGGRQAKAEGG